MSKEQDEIKSLKAQIDFLDEELEILKKVGKELKSYAKIGKKGQEQAKEEEHEGFWRGWLKATDLLTSHIQNLKEMK